MSVTAVSIICIYHNNFKSKGFNQHDNFIRLYTKSQPFKCCRNNHCVLCGHSKENLL